MEKTEREKETMKYRLSKDVNRQAELNIRQRMAELAAGTKSIQWFGWMPRAGITTVKSWKEMRRIVAEDHKVFDALFKARMRRLSKGIQ